MIHMNLSLRNRIALGLIIASLILLYFGLFLPVFTLKIGITLPLLGDTSLYEQTQSVVESIRFLYENDNAFVGFLILFFSILIPIMKAVLLLIVLVKKELSKRFLVFKFVSKISKWSMADVFVVGVFIAYLSTKSNENIIAELETGFYFFLSYCIVSLVAVQTMSVEEY